MSYDFSQYHENQKQMARNGRDKTISTMGIPIDSTTGLMTMSAILTIQSPMRLYDEVLANLNRHQKLSYMVPYD